jgi:hypothetical protein
MLSTVKANLYKDLNQIAHLLIKFWKIEFRQEAENLNDPILRWLDFRLRYVDPIPRKLLYSNKFPLKLPHSVSAGLHILIDKLQRGVDINQYQSKGLTRFDDLSSKRKSKRTDLLWADWGILHFHITDLDLPSRNLDYYSNRSCSDGESWLLFCIFNGKEVGLIDVRHHSDPDLFSDVDLFKTMKESWPHYVEQFRLNGLSAGKNFTNEQIQQLRKVGVANAINIDDGVYLGPGLGITSASTPHKVKMFAGKIYDRLDILAQLVCLEDGQLESVMIEQGIKEPKFELRLTPTGLTLCESVSNIAFTFSNHEELKDHNHSAILSEMFCPPWATKGLLKPNFKRY